MRVWINPASKQDLISHAKSKNAPSVVIDTLDLLPDQMFNSPIDVSKV